MIETRQDLEEYLAADLHAQDLSAGGTATGSCTGLPYFQRMLRKTEYWTNTARTPISRLVAAYLRLRLKFLGEKLGFGIPLNAFGPGLSVAHVGWVHVHHRAKIGVNCRIHQGVTLGEGRRANTPPSETMYSFTRAPWCSAPMSAAVSASTRARW